MLNAEFKKGEHLDLRYRGITDLAEIGIELKFKGLERLDQNEMETLTHLEFLDLTWNRITSLAGLERLAKLRALYLSHNDIRKVAEVARLQPLAGTLTELSLCNNPLPREISDEASSIKGVKRLLELASIYDDDRPSGPCSSCNNWVNSGDGVEVIVEWPSRGIYETRFVCVSCGERIEQEEEQKELAEGSYRS